MPRPKQTDLPGMEDKEIKPLVDSARKYAEIRDQRIALNQDEATLKAELLRLMKKHGKELYSYDGVEVSVVHESETVEVKVKQAEAEPGDEDDE